MHDGHHSRPTNIVTDDRDCRVALIRGIEYVLFVYMSIELSVSGSCGSCFEGVLPYALGPHVRPFGSICTLSKVLIRERAHSWSANQHTGSEIN